MASLNFRKRNNMKVLNRLNQWKLQANPSFNKDYSIESESFSDGENLILITIVGVPHYNIGL